MTRNPRRSCPTLPPAAVLALLTAVCLSPASRAGIVPTDLELVPVVTSGIDRPVAVRNAGDGSGRLFIVEQGGLIKIWDGEALLPTPFLDVVNAVCCGERGLLGLAFHPDYESNGFFYVNYTAFASPGRTRISRFSVSAGDPDVADPGSETFLLEIVQDFGNHNGGDIHFGPDGYLYIGMGDGGSAGDPNNRSQDMGELLGKMLRIDVDSGPGQAPDCGLVGNYTVPSSNPFVDGAGGNCDEIWAAGVRNPFRWSFDRQTGDMFIGDVGQNAVEEIDFEPIASTGGYNWGWRCYEGSAPFNTAGCGPIGNYDFPILEYGHSGGNCSVSGGFRYRGALNPDWGNPYFYADYCTGNLWVALEISPGTWSSELFQNTPYSISGFGEDERGELYVIDLGDGVYRLQGSGIFVDGFESGDLSAWSTSLP